MTHELLGHDERGRPICVVWVEGSLLEGVSAMALHGFACPGCARAWPLARPGGIFRAVHQTPGCRSVSDSCPCGVVLHVDATPAGERDGLGWVRVARGGVLNVPGGATGVAMAEAVIRQRRAGR